MDTALFSIQGLQHEAIITPTFTMYRALSSGLWEAEHHNLRSISWLYFKGFLSMTLNFDLWTLFVSLLESPDIKLTFSYGSWVSDRSFCLFALLFGSLTSYCFDPSSSNFHCSPLDHFDKKPDWLVEKNTMFRDKSNLSSSLGSLNLLPNQLILWFPYIWQKGTKIPGSLCFTSICSGQIRIYSWRDWQSRS